MKKHKFLIALACVLVACSAVLFIIDFLVFGDLRDNMFYLLQDVAFLPLQILFVGIIVERIMARREIEEKIQKMNMAVGTFFSEIGNRLTMLMLDCVGDKTPIFENLHVKGSWELSDYANARKFAAKEATVTCPPSYFVEFKLFLVNKRAFLLSLIENPNLLEHERFTDLLLAVFHLCEELESRPSLSGLPVHDVEHINGDITRVYRFLVVQWLDYMQHLKTHYPFLYSHYLRIHPFQPNPSAVIP